MAPVEIYSVWFHLEAFDVWFVYFCKQTLLMLSGHNLSFLQLLFPGWWCCWNNFSYSFSYVAYFELVFFITFLMIYHPFMWISLFWWVVPIVLWISLFWWLVPIVLWPELVGDINEWKLKFFFKKISSE